MPRLALFGVPLRRRIQMLCIILTVWVQPIGIAIYLALWYFKLTRPLALLYTLWIFVDTYVLKTPARGGRKWAWIRELRWWNLFKDYFPVRLHKTANLDPTKNYIFGYHPHGIIGIGAFCNFLTESTHFKSLFPGISLNLLGLKLVSLLPISRDLLLLAGACDVSRESCDHILQEGQRQGGGRAIMIVVGGAKEALDAHPDKMELTLRSRKGFVKVALQNGASLVPTISFGENDLFHQVSNAPGTFVRGLQNLTQKFLGFSTPLVYGRGIFNYDFGFIPFRTPINTVVGAPIDVDLIADPTSEDIDKLHCKYLTAVEELFNAHKDKYMKPGSEIIIK